MNRTPLAALAAFLCAGALAAQEPIKIKTATLAPEGSTWMNVLAEMNSEVQEKTGGKVVFVFFPGGSLGDDKLVVKKLRTGGVQAAGITGLGLGEILPEGRILDVPYLYRNSAETDRIRERLVPRFEQAMEAKGYVVLGWSDAGAVYLFSHAPLRNLDDIRKRKVWVWEGDQVAETAFRATGVAPIPLAFPDVMTSLQTGLVDTVYISPIGAIALQWFSKVRTMTTMPILDAVSLLVVSKKAWDKIPADLQPVVREITRKHSRRLVELTRKENEDSIRVLRDKGIEMVQPDESMRPEFDRIASQVGRELVGKLYPQELLDEVLKALAEMRAGK